MGTPSEYELLHIGGYANVFYNKDSKLVKKVQSRYIEMDDKRKILHYSTIVDLVMHNSLRTIPGLPITFKYKFTTDTMQLVMPYYGRMLHNVIANVPESGREQFALHVASQLVDICMHLLHNGVQHTDLKPSNILYNTHDQVTIIDFNNVSTMALQDSQIYWSEGIGTWNYVAPEIVYFSTPSDTSMVWSIGLLIALMMTNSFPLEKKHQPRKDTVSRRRFWQTTYKTFQQNSASLPLPSAHQRVMSEQLQYIFERCAQFNPKDRLTLSELRSMLYIYKHHSIPPPLLLHSVSWTADPTSIPRDIRRDLVYKAFDVCTEFNKMCFFTRIVSWIDRLPFEHIHDLDVAACFCLAWMLHGDYVFDDPDTAMRLTKVLDIPNAEDILMLHMIDVGMALDWNMWEKTIEVHMMEMCNRVDFPKIVDTMLSISEPYTMEDIAMRCT